MAQSYVTFTGNGSSTGPITLGFNYILKSHVKVYQARDILANTGVLLAETNDYTFNAAGTQISMVSAPANGVVITVERQTPNDDQIVPYADGSNLIADSLNNSDKQTLFCTQELEDRQELSAAKADAAKTASETATNDVATLTANYFKRDGTLPMTGALQLGTNKITGVGDPTNAQDAVTKAYLERSGSIASAQIVDGTIVNGDIANTTITGGKLVNDTITANQIASNAITANELADNSVVTAKLAADAVTSGKLADNSVVNANLTTDCVSSDNLADNAVRTEQITDGHVTTTKIADAAITSLKIANATILTEDIADGQITQAKLANSNVINSAQIQDNAVTVAKIADAELTTLAGMQAATASKLASSTALTSDIADLNQIDGLTKQTTISDSDASFPTSGAVVDYVAAQIAPLGGLEVVATEVAFPNTQPASGVVISISDAGGVVVNGSGVSTTGRTSGGATVTINGFPSSLQGETLAAGVGLMVSSTGSSQTYNYHKILGKEDDIKQLSDDINDFNERYRVENTLPAANSSTNHNGDLVWAKDVGKMYVYNGDYNGTPVGSFGEVQSIGNFYISTLSPAFNGTLQDFTITNAPSSAEQILLSINGVLQRPNAGNSTPSEGFALSGSTVKLAAAPANTDNYFAVVIGSTVNIGTPSNNTVTEAILQSNVVSEEKLKVGNSPTNGKFLQAQSGQSGGLYWETVITDLASDTSPQLGGDLDVNGNSIVSTSNGNIDIDPDGTGDIVLQTTTGAKTQLNGVGGDVQFVSGVTNKICQWDYSQAQLEFWDGVKVSFGSGEDLEIYSAGSGAKLHCNSGVLELEGDNVHIWNHAANECMAKFTAHGAVELYFDNSKQLETTANGIQINDYLLALKAGSGSDAHLQLIGDNGAQNNDFFRLTAGNGISAWENYSSGSWATNLRVKETGEVQIPNDTGKYECGSSGDLKIYHDGSHSRICAYNAGNLLLKSQNDTKIEFGDDGGATEVGINAIRNGAVQLFWNNAKQFETKSNGVTVLGDIGFADAGAGIDFGANNHASGMASEKFDKYEEGSWTPTIVGSGTVGTATYGSNTRGDYTVIGNRCFINCYIEWSNGNGSGNLGIAGFPYAVKALSACDHTGAVMMANVTISNPDDVTSVVSYTGNALTKAWFYTTRSAANWTTVPYDGGGEIIFSMQYRIQD